MIFCHSSNGVSSECEKRPMPAQLKTSDGRPSSFAAASTAGRTESGSETSTV